MRASGRTNAKLAFVATLLILATVAAEASMRPRPDGVAATSLAGARAELDANVLTLHLPDGARAAIDPQAIRVLVAGQPRTPFAVEEAPEGALRAYLVEGAGSADEARVMVYADPAAADEGGGALLDLPVDVVTARFVLPGPRWGAGVAAAEGVAYVLGGAVTPEGPAGPVEDAWRALDTILRLDLATGEVSTLQAHLPVGVVAGSAVWDPRATEACPEGCAYLFAGMDAGRSLRSNIVRYDPARDVAATMAAHLPNRVVDPAAFFTGTHAIVVGGGMVDVVRFDPLEDTTVTLVHSPLTSLWGMSAFFDPRPSPACPEGCGYVVGGKVIGDLLPPLTTMVLTRDQIVRVDAQTGAATPMPTRLPWNTQYASVAFDGARAYVLGGRSCAPDACRSSDGVVAFDPATGLLEPLAPIPERPESASAVWHDGAILLPNGKDGDGRAFGAVVRYVPEG